MSVKGKRNYVEVFKSCRDWPKHDNPIPLPKNRAPAQLDRLYKDIFSNSGRTIYQPPDMQYSDKTERLISEDSLDSKFFEEYYIIPKKININNGINENYYTYDAFLSRILEFNDTGTGENANFGSNTVMFLSGEKGDGKTTLLLKTIYDIKKMKEDVITLYLSIQLSWSEKELDEPEPRDFDDKFYTELYERLLHICEIKEPKLVGVSDDIREDLKPYIKLVKLIESIRLRGFRVIIYLDDLDAFHYYYDKYIFFDDKNIISNSVKKISSLCHQFLEATEGKELSCLGITVIFACRDYVLRIIERSPGMNMGRLEYTSYSLDKPDYIMATKSRFNLFIDSLKYISEQKDAAYWNNIFDNALAGYNMLSGYLDKTKNHKVMDEFMEGDSLRSIFYLTHHGCRSLVDFFHDLRIFSAIDADVLINRLLASQHGHSALLIIYMLNHKLLYSQNSNHFPNLFLVDASKISSPKNKKLFPDAFKPHIHTFWLKYFVLALIHANDTPDDGITTKEILQIICRNSEYEDHIVKLCVGSLTTPNHFSCVSLDFGINTDPLSRSLSLINRGKFLLDPHPQSRRDTPFCFSFTYIQLLSHDHMLSLPKEYFPTRRQTPDYAYLYSVDSEYHKDFKEMIDDRSPIVIRFLTMLEASLEIEFERAPELKKALISSGVQLPEFKEIFASLDEEVNGIVGDNQYAHNNPCFYEHKKAELKDEFLTFFRDAYLGEDAVEVV